MHLNKATLHRAQLALNWVTMFRMSLFKSLRPTQPGHTSVGRYNEYWWSWLPWWSWLSPGKKLWIQPNSRPCEQHGWHTHL